MSVVPSSPLTEKQRAIFNFMIQCTLNNLYQPSMKEIMAHFGFRSNQAVTDHLRALSDKGLIDLANGSARAIRFHRRTPIGGDE